MNHSVLLLLFLLKEKTPLHYYNMEATNREKWKSVNGFANYEISSCGRVRNATTEWILKHRARKDGYLDVWLSKNGTPKQLLVHRLVAEAFFENPTEKRCVDHRDGDRTNNHIENLRYATHAENNRHRSKRANATSAYYGVCWHKSAGKWNAQIQIEGKRKNLGFFTDEKEAAEVFNKAAAEFYKEFRKINVFSD